MPAGAHNKKCILLPFGCFNTITNSFKCFGLGGNVVGSFGRAWAMAQVKKKWPRNVNKKDNQSYIEKEKKKGKEGNKERLYYLENLNGSVFFVVRAALLSEHST